MDPDFEAKIRNSFKKVREDIEIIKKEIEKLKEDLNLQNKANLVLKSDVGYPNQPFNEIKRPIQDISIGNDRVSNDDQRSMTMNDNAKQLRFLLENKFRSLTDREFSVFMAVYQLEEELGTVTYQDIANKLNISGSNLRNHVSTLISKGIPVGKERLFNGKTTLFIKKELRDLNIVADLIELRQHKTFKQ